MDMEDSCSESKFLRPALCRLLGSMIASRAHSVDNLAGHGRICGLPLRCDHDFQHRPSSSHAAHLPPGARAPFGEHLRHWRQHRRLSQQGLALEAEISTRHLSYVETGRAQPSREMVLRLAERLSVPLRERNALLVAAGFAPCTRPARWTIPIWPPRARP